MRSMTGYGRAISQELNGLQWEVEIQGVNRKMLDLNVYLPKELLYLEQDVREQIHQVVERGQINVRIHLKQSSNWQSSKTFLSSLKTLKSTWVHLASDLGYGKEAIDLPFLLNRLEKLSLDELPIDQKKLRVLLLSTLKGAIQDFLEMKRKEGERLGEDLQKRLEAIQKCVIKIEKEGSQSPLKFYQKLKDRIKELTAATAVDEERILREVALYAEKADISEEITRLHSHLKQAFALFKKKDKSIGRTFDFLIQEMQREISTTSAKSATLEMTNLALFAKAELEKIREQVQNLE